MGEPKIRGSLKTALLVCCSFLSGSLLPAHLAAAERTGLAFLKIGAGTRSVALGEAVVSHVDDASATYWNPGAVALLAGTQAELMHNESFHDVRYEFVSLTHRLGRHGVGLSFNGVWTENLHAYDESGQRLPDFAYYGMDVSGSYGFAWSDQLGLGLSVEFLREQVDVYSTDGLALSLGAQYREILPRTEAGFAVHHLGSSMKYEGESFDLPTSWQGGLSHRLPLPSFNGDFRVAAEVRGVRGEDAQLLIGTEYQYQDFARLEAGYRSGLDTQDVSFGVGVGQGKLRGQYAYVPFGENLGEQHRFSVLLAW